MARTLTTSIEGGRDEEEEVESDDSKYSAAAEMIALVLGDSHTLPDDELR